MSDENRKKTTHYICSSIQIEHGLTVLTEKKLRERERREEKKTHFKAKQKENEKNI